MVDVRDPGPDRGVWRGWQVSPRRLENAGHRGAVESHRPETNHGDGDQPEIQEPDGDDDFRWAAELLHGHGSWRKTEDHEESANQPGRERSCGSVPPVIGMRCGAARIRLL